MTSATTLLLLAVVTVNTGASHALLKRGVVGLNAPASMEDAGRLLAHCSGSPFVWASLTLQVIGYAIWIVVISRERLAVATAVSGSLFYFLMAGLGWIFFNERLSVLQVAGLALITVGVVMVSSS